MRNPILSLNDSILKVAAYLVNGECRYGLKI